MKIFKVHLKKTAKKELKKLPKMLLPKVLLALKSLEQNPRPEGSKKLKGEKEYLWRIRVGNYRVIYLIEEEIKVVEIRKIGHRKDVYF